MPKKRIETATSRTAEMTCISRAISSLEKDRHYRSDDYIAVRLLPRLLGFLIRIPLFRRIISRRIAPIGVYEYVIARTKYIDAVFKEALAEKFGQVLIFGAGFDTRALRFGNEAGDTKIFELDAPITQNAKIGQYRKRGLPIPTNVVFVPVDFDRESIASKLDAAGFDRDKRSLFILEGLLMYLQPQSVDVAFRTIRAFAGKGSEIVFDHVYASVLRHENLYYGEAEVAHAVSKAGEEWHFGIEKGEIERFLAAYDLGLIDQRNAEALEEMYFRGCPGKAGFDDAAGNHVGLMNGTHCLVRAVRA
jgi:methyltransferase (TIGR00027 family)